MKKHPLFCVSILIMLVSACASTPGNGKLQHSQWYYTFTILLDPDRPHDSPQLDIALSLLNVKYPVEQAEYLNKLLYSTNSFDEYKDRVIEEQRKKYRDTLFDITAPPIVKNPANHNWRYAETVSIKNSGRQGIIIERDYYIYSGGAHGLNTKRYYVIDMDQQKQIKIDDLFANYQGDKRLRDIVYFELGKYSKLQNGQKLSEGIFFSDDPELSFNFFVSNEGLGLHWNPYQIAPYAYGNIKIIMPWQVIRPLMLTEGIELLTKFGIYLFV